MKLIRTWLALTGLALANPVGPGESAVGFLERVRSGTVNLEPGGDTALAPSTGMRKREEISRRLQRLAEDLGKESLAIGTIRQEDDLAAVLVRTNGGFDPARLQIFPVALVRRGAAWLAAPMPASFENSGIGYSPDHRRLIDSLESWMLRERVILLEKLRDQSANELRSKIAAAIPIEEIRSLTPTSAGQRFLAACSGRRLPEILGLLGGLSSDLPDQWPAILNSAENAIRSPASASRAWRLLTAPEIIRVPVFQDDAEDSSTLSVGCLDPAGGPDRSSPAAIEILHLPIMKSADGMWRVGIPPEPLIDDDADKTLLAMFPARFALGHPSAPAASAADIRDQLLAAFESDDPTTWTRLIHISGDPEKQISACQHAASTWWETRDASSMVRPLLLDFHESDSLAAAAFQFFSARHPDRSDIRLLIFTKTPAGWLWTPLPSDVAVDTIREWSESRLVGWQDGWQGTLLANCPKVDLIEVGSAPDSETASRLVNEWIDSIDRGDLRASLGLIAYLDRPDSRAQLLRNLGYEFAASRRSQIRTEPVSVFPGKRISAVGTRTDSDGKHSFPLFPIVHTPSGPRILLEIDLIQSSGRSREFLNRTALDRLKKQDPAAATELADLFRIHCEKTSSGPKP